MSTPIYALVTGTFTSDGTPLNISIPSGYNDFDLINITDIGSTAANNNVMKARGTSSMSAASAYYSPKTSGAATLDPETTTTTGGFTFISDSSAVANGGAVTITAINRANPAVVSTATTTGLVASSSVVRLFSTTGMLQVSSMDFTIGTISAGVNFQLKYLNDSGFAADATAGSYRIINATSLYYPRRRYITAITAANPAVVTLSVTHGFTAGQKVRIIVPTGFGMTELNGTLATITAVSTANNTITLDTDTSSGYTTFAFPTSATAAAGVTFPQVVPVGEAAINSTTYPYGNLLDDATDNQGISGITVGATVQTTGKLYQYFARRGVSV